MTQDEYNRIREYIDIMFNERDKALRIQAIEYDRRLKALNNEAGQLKDMQEKYVLRTELSSTLPVRLENIDKDIRNLRDYQNRQEGSIKSMVYIYGILITIANLAIGVGLHFIH